LVIVLPPGEAFRCRECGEELVLEYYLETPTYYRYDSHGNLIEEYQGSSLEDPKFNGAFCPNCGEQYTEEELEDLRR